MSWISGSHAVSDGSDNGSLDTVEFSRRNFGFEPGVPLWWTGDVLGCNIGGFSETSVDLNCPGPRALLQASTWTARLSGSSPTLAALLEFGSGPM
jgi:hypothetical protein